jgi:hypothetical protein
MIELLLDIHALENDKTQNGKPDRKYRKSATGQSRAQQRWRPRRSRSSYQT